MPEAAEVNIFADRLKRYLLNKTLTDVEIINDKFIKRTKSFDKIVLPQKVVNVACKGKFSYIELEDGSAFGITYGMTGSIKLEPSKEHLKRLNETRDKYLKHAMVMFKADDDTQIYYCDITRFGYIYYQSPKELKSYLSKLGPSILNEEPLSDVEIISIWRKAQNKNICDALITDQNLISGIGNVLKIEGLYACGIHPSANVKSISDGTLVKLYNSIREIAQLTYASGGASKYTESGTGEEETKIYQKSYDPEGNEVKTMKTSDGRSTYYVPKVQTIGLEQIKAKVKPKLKIQES